MGKSILNKSAIARELNISVSYANQLLNGKKKSRKYQYKIRQLVVKAAEELKTKAA